MAARIGSCGTLPGRCSERGHEVDTVEIPFISNWEKMLEQMLAIRLMDVSAASDVLIAIRTPSYLLRHPNKRLWFIHHHRGAYDLWGTPYQDIPPTPEGRRCGMPIFAADNLYLREAERIFTNSQIVATACGGSTILTARCCIPRWECRTRSSPAPRATTSSTLSQLVGTSVSSSPSKPLRIWRPTCVS